MPAPKGNKNALDNEGGRPAIYDDPQKLSEAIEDYFNPMTYTEEKTKQGIVKSETGRQPRTKVTMSGLAYHLGFESRQSIYDYKEKVEFSYIIKRALLLVEMSYEQRLSEQACTGSIFALKNMGWKDKTEVDQNTTLTVNWPEERTFG